MAAFLITGSPGTGKSTTIAELREEGYSAYDTDSMADVTGFYDLASDQWLPEPPKPPIDFTRYAWNWDMSALDTLIHSDNLVFIGAITGNTKQNLHLFDGVFALHVKKDVLTERLLSRTTNSFGKHPDELNGILIMHKQAKDYWTSKGAVIIKAAAPPKKVAKRILRYCETM